jgi:hypothetical protein
MRWRDLEEADLPACLAFEPRNIGAEIVGHDVALQVWRRLLHEGHLQGAVIESEASNRPQIVAAGARVFVTDTFADQELAHPRPGLNSRVIASVALGDPVLLPPKQIGHRNARGGLDLVILLSSWRERAPKPEQLGEINALLAESFLEAHQGYRLNRTLREVVGRPDEIEVLESSGTFRILARWPEETRALAVQTREDAHRIPYTITRLMFRYVEPVLRLSPSERDLLAAALKCGTDAAIGAALGLPVATIKKRWLSIFTKVSRTNPDLLGVLDDNARGRGKQKRHLVLEYIRSHPEELRPFAYASGPHEFTRRRRRK